MDRNFHESKLQNDIALIAEVEALRISYSELRSRSMEMECNMSDLKQQKEEDLKLNLDLVKAVEEISLKLHQVEISAKEREGKLIKQRDEEIEEKLEVLSKFEVSQERVSELMEVNSRRIRVYSWSLDSVKDCVLRVIEKIEEDKTETNVAAHEPSAEELDLDEESKGFLMEIMYVYKLVMKAESRLTECAEMRRKEKRELENSVVSLTEENRDVNSWLRIALVEKEAVERNLSRLKGGGEQKKLALLQFAERGLQKVGFGFMMGASLGDPSDDSGSTASGKADNSECEEEAVSLASTVEKIMKNLRLEITQLKQFLEESRSDNERLQNLIEKQAQKIAECTSYINDLEKRQTRLSQNIEELMMEITGAQEEVERWRAACELEVEAGKNAIEEHKRVAMILKEELDEAKASLNTLNSKIELKEQLAAAAVAAQEAAQKSLQVADRRAAELHERVEEVTRQLEVVESKRERNIRLKVRHICWPWRALKVNKGRPRSRGATRRMVPEMQGLLHFRI